MNWNFSVCPGERGNAARRTPIAGRSNSVPRREANCNALRPQSQMFDASFGWSRYVTPE